MRALSSRHGLALLVVVGWSHGAQIVAGDEVPIQGRLTGTVKVTPLSTTAPVFRVDNVATGRVFHLGRVKAAWASPKVTVDVSGPRLIVADPNWIGTLTAANGDQIFGTYVLPEVIPLTPAGDFSTEAELIVVDGTGRFEDAEGEAQAFITGNVFTGAFSIQMVGWISLGDM